MPAINKKRRDDQRLRTEEEETETGEIKGEFMMNRFDCTDRAKGVNSSD